MNQEIKQIKDEFEQAKVKFKKEGENILKKMFVRFFNENPLVTKVMWTQYTPYFNDGEPCYFGVNEPEVKVDLNKASEAMKKVFTTNYANCSDDYQYGDATAVNAYGADKSEFTQEEKDIETSFNNTIGGVFELTDVLQNTFGDHVLVVATRNGFTFSNYDHD